MYKTMVKVSQAQKRLDVLHTNWYMPLRHSINLSLSHLDTISWYNMPKEFNFWQKQCTFFTFKMPVMRVQLREYLHDMLLMLVCWLTKNQDIVHVDQHASVEQLRHEEIHATLEVRRRIFQSKRQYNHIERSIPTCKRSFKSVVFSYGYLMVSIAKV